MKEVATRVTSAVNVVATIQEWFRNSFPLTLLRKKAGCRTTNASEAHHDSVVRKISKNVKAAQGRALGCRQFLAFMTHFEGQVWVAQNVLSVIYDYVGGRMVPLCWRPGCG